MTRAASARAHGVPLDALVAAALDLSPGESVGVLIDDGGRNAPPPLAARPLPVDPAPAAQR